MKSSTLEFPWYFRLDKWIIKNRIRHSYHLLKNAEYLGLHNKVGRSPLNSRIALNALLNRSDT